MKEGCQFILADGTKCGAACFGKHSYCYPHYLVCYDTQTTQKLKKRTLEGLADLKTIPSGRLPKGWKW